MHYSLLNCGIAFASEIRSLLAAKVWGGEVNQRALYQYLDFGHILPPETMFKGIHKLSPGCALIYEDGQVRTKQIFKLTFQPQTSDNRVES